MQAKAEGSVRRRSPSKRRKKTMAERADRHALYEQSVQDPPTDAATLAKLYRRFRKKSARSLREDFCGTATLATAWVEGGKGRSAVGVDLDGPTLDWGREHNLGRVSKALASRIELIEGNVLDAKGPKADLTCALNFSYCCIKQRKGLVGYFKAVRKLLKKDGLFIMDVLGGTETMGPDENRRAVNGFTYCWKQHYFDPLTHEMRCSISFSFSDGSALEPAFEYDWRLWTMPELVDACSEAGFGKVHRLWEKTDERGEGTGSFIEPKRVENQESWWTYLVVER